MCASHNDDGTIVPASFTALAEQSAAVSGVVSASGDAPVILNYFWSMKKAYGPNYPTNLLRGNVSANPTETSCVTIAVQSSDADFYSGSCICRDLVHRSVHRIT